MLCPYCVWPTASVAVNSIAGQSLVLTGEPVVSSAGLEIRAGWQLKSLGDMNVLMVCGGYNIKNYCTKSLLDALRAMDKKKIPLGGMCTGSYALAAAGLLDGYRSTIHWENIASMREQFPKLNISSSLFVIDRDRYTCSGGISSIDLMLNLSGQYSWPPAGATDLRAVYL